jgi:hypothetical protein
MKFVEFALSGGEDVITVNVAFIVSVLGGNEEAVITLSTGETLDLAETYSDVMEKLRG